MFFERILSILQDNLTLFILEVVFLFVLFYFVMIVLKRNNAQLLNIVFAVFILATGALFFFTESEYSAVYLIFPLLYIIAMLAVFSTEIKRVLWNISNKKGGDAKNQDLSKDKNSTKECINEIVKALQNMSKNDIGALIILASAPIPHSILESGVYMDCEISCALIESVFFPKTPLHDGAMVISGNKILAAGCFLPLSQEVNIPKDLGTRHRAGIGITEAIDVTAIIVSEETGVISIANGGKIKRYADSEMLRQTLAKFYAQENMLQK